MIPWEGLQPRQRRLRAGSGLKPLPQNQLRSLQAMPHRLSLVGNQDRDWKIQLIEKGNPKWRNLYESLV